MFWLPSNVVDEFFGKRNLKKNFKIFLFLNIIRHTLWKLQTGEDSHAWKTKCLKNFNQSKLLSVSIG